jgi:peptidyl-prolyl cis-trans isomerase C
MKKISLLTTAICFAGITCFAAETPATPKTDDNAAAVKQAAPVMPKMPEVDPKVWDFVPEVVATIGDKNITKEQLVKTLTPQVRMLMAMGRKLTDQQYQEMAKAMTDELVKATALEDLASAAGYKVTPGMEEATFEKFTKKFEEQLPKDQKISFADIIKKQGLDINDVKKQMAEAEVVQNWIKEKIEPEVNVTADDAKAFYDKNKDTFFKKPETVTASHILIKPVFEKDGKKIDKEKAWATAKEQADKVYKEVKDGGNFAELAKKYSDGPSGKNGGKLGSFAKGQMVPEFETLCWDLALQHAKDEGSFNAFGEVKTQFGWHIVDVTGYDAGGFVKLDDALTKQIETQLKQEKTAEKIKALVDTKVKELKPVINLKVETPAPADAATAKPADAVK